jgi:hypothetical protein
MRNGVFKTKYRYAAEQECSRESGQKRPFFFHTLYFNLLIFLNKWKVYAAGRRHCSLISLLM